MRLAIIMPIVRRHALLPRIGGLADHCPQGASSRLRERLIYVLRLPAMAWLVKASALEQVGLAIMKVALAAAFL